MDNPLKNPTAAKSMSKMYLESEFADVHFVFPNDDSARKLSAHRAILATASPVFKAMFFGPLKDGGNVKITDSNAKAFEEFLQFFYLPEVKLSIENIEEVLHLTDKYDMLDCFGVCATFLKANLTIENMVWGYQLAITLDNEELMKFCGKRIQAFASEIVKSEIFLHCSREVLKNLLNMNVLDCDEVELFNACIEWAKISCQKNGLDEMNAENVKNQLGTQFYSIRFAAMKQEEVANILQAKVVEFTTDELADIWCSKWAKEHESNFFNHHPRSKLVFPWNANDKLVCAREYQSAQSDYKLQQQESTWFSSNDLILLGEIGFINVPRNWLYFIEIFEHDKDNFAEGESTKLLYTKNSDEFTIFTLDKTIAIRPNKMYEIRLRRASVDNDVISHTWIFGDVNLNEKIKITFHQNPLENNSTCRGLVYKLYFNQLK